MYMSYERRYGHNFPMHWYKNGYGSKADVFSATLTMMNWYMT